ncbi:MAG: hypothetical protein COB85_07565 [Bacteroidetes bacterium]|nr:MAG: hypothetical protein COB85_07565 [Bacteroidota bacterium]
MRNSETLIPFGGVILSLVLAISSLWISTDSTQITNGLKGIVFTAASKEQTKSATPQFISDPFTVKLQQMKSIRTSAPRQRRSQPRYVSQPRTSKPQYRYNTSKTTKRSSDRVLLEIVRDLERLKYQIDALIRKAKTY